MKPVRWMGLLSLVMLLVALPLKAAGDFEGEVDMKMSRSNSDKSVMMQYFVKGHKIRTQTESSDSKYSGGAIMDLQTHQLIMVMDKQKMYMVSQTHPEKFHYGQDKHFKMHNTGKTETILGYRCQEWDWTSDDGSGKIWFAQGIGNWLATSMAAQSDKLSPEQKAMVNLILSKKMFPLKFESSDKSGKITGTMEVTKIEKKSLRAGLFEPPAGYKKFDADFLKNMGGKIPGL